jgi:hypothetical protein
MVRKRNPNIRHNFPVDPIFPTLDWMIDGSTMSLIPERVPLHDLCIDEGDPNSETVCYYLVTFRTSDI